MMGRPTLKLSWLWNEVVATPPGAEPRRMRSGRKFFGALAEGGGGTIGVGPRKDTRRGKFFDGDTNQEWGHEWLGLKGFKGAHGNRNAG
jgi:hypothetical protein